MHKSSQRSAMLLGFAVFVALMVLEAIEYVIGLGLHEGALPVLVLLAVPGAGVILWYFMHLPQLWGGEE